MTPTPVGMRCPDCSRDRTRVHRLNPMPDRPLITTALIAVNVAVFLVELATGSGVGQGGGGTLIQNGALYGPAVAFGDEYWRLVSSGFLHSGLFHIGFNMWFIWVLGGMLEPALGRLRFAVLYATALLCGSFGVLLLEPDAVTVGASGAAFGLLGAAIVEMRARGIDIWASGLGVVAVLNFVITFAIPGISIGGHVGGFLGGGLVALVYNQADRRRLPRAAAVAVCVAIAVAAVVGGIALADGTGLLGESRL
jgi:membrane associated rhomboid family serine protease